MNKTIALLHNQYRQDHLDKVIEEMTTLGAPEIRCIWAECYDLWLAVEGCHRLRAAQKLGLTPIIVDVSSETEITIQVDDEQKTENMTELIEDLVDEAWLKEVIEFE